VPRDGDPGVWNGAVQAFAPGYGFFERVVPVCSLYWVLVRRGRKGIEGGGELRKLDCVFRVAGCFLLRRMICSMSEGVRSRNRVRDLRRSKIIVS
jgi:hypothetical protein